MRRLNVEFNERQLACFGYMTSLNAYLDYLEDSLFEMLGCRKEHYGSFLDGICGDSFRVFYSRKKRMEGTFCYPFNPLKITAESLGYEYEYTYGANEKDALSGLRAHMDEGRPVIVPLILPPPEWALVIGWDEVRWYLHSFAGMKNYPEEEFRKAFSSSWWQPTLNSSSPQAAHPMFALRKRGMRKDIPMLIIEALQRGAELMKMETFSWNGEEYYAGFRALEERAKELEEERDWDNPEETLLNWNFYPFLYYQLSRWSRTGFLSISARQFRGMDSEKLKRALTHTEQVNSLVKSYRDALSVPWPKSPPNSEEIVKEKLKDGGKREKGVSILRKMADCEREAIGEIESMIA